MTRVTRSHIEPHRTYWEIRRTSGAITAVDCIEVRHNSAATIGQTLEGLIGAQEKTARARYDCRPIRVKPARLGGIKNMVQCSSISAAAGAVYIVALPSRRQ
jgi:hypothetical protein